MEKRVIVTAHAKERMVERGVCKKFKVQRVAEKAWLKGGISSARYNIIRYHKAFAKEQRQNHDGYRELMGFIYVFMEEEKVIKLVTVYHL